MNESKEINNPNETASIPTWIIFAGVVSLSLFLRMAYIGEHPPGLNSDELLKAFDGASVYHTGRDHHGAPLPLFFKQSGEYSPPVYIYFSGLFSYCFGINPTSVRLPSALAGTASIIFVFFLMRELAGREAGWIAMALLALSPWSIEFSRIGWEAILQAPLQLAAMLCFFRWLRSKRIHDVLVSAFLFAMTLYAYPTERLFTPLLLVGICGVYWKNLWANRGHAVAAIALFFACQIPYLIKMGSMSEAMQARWLFLSVFQRDDGVLLFFKHYALHLSPMFHFINGLHGFSGLALWITAPFFYYGLVHMIRARKPEHLVFLWWLLIFSIPSSMTHDRYDIHSMPNALRTTCGIGLIEIIAVFGIADLLNKFPKRAAFFRKAFPALLAVNASFFFMAYASHYSASHVNPKDNPFQYGLREAVEYLEANKGEFSQIIVSHNVRLHPISLATFSGMRPRPFSPEDFPKYIIPFFHYLPIYWEYGHREYETLGSIDRWFYQGKGKRLLLARGDELRDEKPVWRFANSNGEPLYKVFEAK